MMTLEEIQAAARRVEKHVVRTPLVPFTGAVADRPLWLKPESLQPTGAFKLRGATNAVAVLSESARRSGVITHSSGNHGRALAHAARAAGVPVTVVMPARSPAVKVDAVRALGATVVQLPDAEFRVKAEEMAAEEGLTLVPPYDDASVIAGQGTVGLEIAADLPDVATVLLPVSGGGLISGVATAVKALCPRVRVVAAEPELAGDLAESFRTGRLTAWSAERTFRTAADGLRATSVGELPWMHIQKYVDAVVTVSESSIERAMRRLAFEARLVAEPSGAVAIAAYLQHLDELPAGPVVAVVSGGNVAPELLGRVLAG